MSEAREDVYDEAYDPPRVFWQTDALYRVEHARRVLKAARQKAAADWAWHNRYEEEARQRAAALQVAQMERAAWWASPEGKAQAAWSDAKRQAERERDHEQDMVRRKYRMPVWAEWVAWQVMAKRTHRSLGDELGVARSMVGRALMDYVYLNHPSVTAKWHGRCPLDDFQRRLWLRQHFKDRAEPLFPGHVVPLAEELPSTAPRTREEFRARNEWIYRQRLAGRTLQEIGNRIALSRGRVDQICWTQAEIDRKRQSGWPKPKPWRAPRNLGRPIDLGDEARDVWLEYRLDQPIEDLRGMWL